MTGYTLVFRMPLEEAFSRRHDWADDLSAIRRSRAQLERFVGPRPPQAGASVAVYKGDEPTEGRSTMLGMWTFDPRTGYQWTPGAELGLAGDQ